VTAGLLVLVLIVTLLLLLATSMIYRFIVRKGVSVISRVMGIILATIAVDAILGGFDTLGILNLGNVPKC
jgi:multiple antibiotic resistance protein